MINLLKIVLEVLTLQQMLKMKKTEMRFLLKTLHTKTKGLERLVKYLNMF